jgi:hypothetical protein
LVGPTRDTQHRYPAGHHQHFWNDPAHLAQSCFWNQMAMLCKSAKMSVMGCSGSLVGWHLNFTRLALFRQASFGEGAALSEKCLRMENINDGKY